MIRIPGQQASPARLYGYCLPAISGICAAVNEIVEATGHPAHDDNVSCLNIRADQRLLVAAGYCKESKIALPSHATNKQVLKSRLKIATSAS